VTFEAMASRIQDDDRVHVTARLRRCGCTPAPDDGTWSSGCGGRTAPRPGSMASGGPNATAMAVAIRLSGNQPGRHGAQAGPDALRELRDLQQEQAEIMRLALDAASAGAWSWEPRHEPGERGRPDLARLGVPPGQPFPPERFETGRASRRSPRARDHRMRRGARRRRRGGISSTAASARTAA
jgi:hypothetical protein